MTRIWTWLRSCWWTADDCERLAMAVLTPDDPSLPWEQS
jgi:hypothetical protein